MDANMDGPDVTADARLEAIRQRAAEVLARSVKSVRPLDQSLPVEDQGLPADASRFCECGRVATVIAEYRDDGILMFWGVACGEHAGTEAAVSISFA